MGSLRWLVGGLALAGALALMALPAAAAEPPLVAAASDLRFALDEVAARFTRETGEAVRIVYGSSGNFRQQIAAGAPFELFLSADEAMIVALAKEGHCLDEGVLYGRGRIALVLPPASPLRPDPTLADVKAAVADGRLRKFAIANPEHAPYGRAAQQALAAAGAWEAIRPRLVLGENVAQAAQFAPDRLGAGRHRRAVAGAGAGGARKRTLRRDPGRHARAAATSGWR